jgi:hypothetical protein
VVSHPTITVYLTTIEIATGWIQGAPYIRSDGILDRHTVFSRVMGIYVEKQDVV